MDLNSENIHNLPQHLYQYVPLLQMIGYFPYIPHKDIETSLDERFIHFELWELEDTRPTLITLPNIQPQDTYLWN
jgi:hypothetical protein